MCPLQEGIRNYHYRARRITKYQLPATQRCSVENVSYHSDQVKMNQCSYLRMPPFTHRLHFVVMASFGRVKRFFLIKTQNTLFVWDT